MFRSIDMDTGEASFGDRIEEDTGEVDVEDVACETAATATRTGGQHHHVRARGYCDRAFHWCVVHPVEADEILQDGGCFPLCDARVDCSTRSTRTLTSSWTPPTPAGATSSRPRSGVGLEKEGPGQENERAKDRPAKGFLDEDCSGVRRVRGRDFADEDFAEGADGDDGDDDDDRAPIRGPLARARTLTPTGTRASGDGCETR